MHIALEGVAGLPAFVEAGAVPRIGEVLVVPGLPEYPVVNVRWFVVEVDDHPQVAPTLQAVVTVAEG